MATHTIKVTGVSDRLLDLLDRRIEEQHATSRAEYLRELIRRDVLGSVVSPSRLNDILAPTRNERTERGYTDHDIEEFVTEALEACRRARRDAASRV